jgi:zinc protease
MKKAILGLAAMFASLQFVNLCVADVVGDVPATPNAAVTAVATPPGLRFNVGGESIALPVPEAKFAELGSASRAKMAKGTPAQFKLVAAYLPENELDGYAKDTLPPLEHFYQIQVMGAVESTPATENDIAIIAKMVGSQLGGRSYETTAEELKTVTPTRLAGGQPFTVGKIVDRPDAWGFCNVFSFKVGDKPYYYAYGTVYFVVKNRLLVATNQKAYNGSQTVREVRDELDAWTRTITAAQNVPEPKILWAQQESDIPADPAATYGVLGNGVKYVVMQNAEPPKRVSLRLHVRAGSLMETDDELGYAHYLEHMAFNGNRHHPGNEIVEYFQRIGMGFGNDTAANTTFDRTLYQFELPNADDATLDEAMQALRDYADGDTLNAKDVENERGVILAEKKTRDSVPYRRMIDSFRFTMPDSIVPNRIPIGEESTISITTREKLLSFYKKWYTPDRLTVIVTGDIDAAKAADLVKKHFGDMPASANPAKDPDLGAVKPRGTVARVLRDAEAPNVLIQITNIQKLPHTPDTVEERQRGIALEIANRIIIRRLQIMVKQPGAPFSDGVCWSLDSLNFARESNFLLVCQSTQWKDALAVAEQQLRKALRYGFTKAELAEAVANTRNNYEQAAKQAATRKSGDLAERMAWNLSNNLVFSSPEEDLKIAAKVFDTITPEGTLAALQDAWKDDTRLIYVAGNVPEDASDALALATYNESAKKAVEAPVNTELAKFAYGDLGKSGEVVWKNEVKDLGITQLKFANNVYVNIKSSDVEKDAVYIRVQFGTGSLEMPKDKAGLQYLANDTLSNGGLKAHTADEIKRLFAGRTVGSYFQVFPDYFMFGGKTNPRDAEAQLNLFAAYIIAPGFRPDGLAQFRSQAEQGYAFMEHTPNGVFMKDVPMLLSSGDYRFGYPEKAKLLALNMDDVRAWLEPVLSHSRIDISIYGDISVDEAIPMLAKTFGALPPRDAEKHDLTESRKVTMQKAQVKTFEYSTEVPKGVSIVALPTDDLWDIARTNRLNVLSAIIMDRMRVELREKLGDTYSPAAINTPNEAYAHYGYLLCISEVNPDKVTATAEAVRKVLTDVAAKGVTQDELDRARKPLVEQLTQMQRGSDYWTGYIMGNCQEHPEKLDWARRGIDNLRAVTVDEINNTAAQYLHEDKVIDIRITPVSATTEAGK